MSASSFLENKILDHLLEGTSYSAPTSLWIALFTADTGLETNAPTSEVSGGGYARKEVKGSTGLTFAAAVDGATSNEQNIEFVEATASWGTVTHAALMDDSTAGNVLIWGVLTTPKTIENEDVFRIKAGDLDVTMD